MKKILSFLKGLSIVMLILHLAFLAMDGMMADAGSLLLLVLPYGLPILLFSVARRGLEKGKTWSKICGFWMGLFICTTLLMFGHVTALKFVGNNSFINVLFNLPLVYLLPMLLFAILWKFTLEVPMIDGVKQKRKGTILIKLIGFAMVVHCGIIGVGDYLRYAQGSYASSAPWYLMTLILVFAYLLSLAVAVLIVGLLNQQKKA